ncbi:MAG: beta-N-acetylhexosaminidase [Candidatus Hydrogenedentota bacterium]
MAPTLIPQPKFVKWRDGTFEAPKQGTVGIPAAEWLPAAQALVELFPGYTIHGNVDGVHNTITFAYHRKLKPEGYTLSVRQNSMVIEADGPAGARHAVSTLAQILAQSKPGKLPLVRIRDWPDFAVRGITCDVSRGRVPTTEALAQLGQTLGAYKMNQVHLYIEHTFRYRGHPDIGKKADPLTADDLLALDAAWAECGVTLVPALATFGHMANILTLPQYRDLAEDWGVGRYAAPEAEDLPDAYKRRGWTLSPANPDTYAFVYSLLSEVLPLVAGPYCNICCDETWDLGLGQSYMMRTMMSREELYLEHVLKVAEMARKLGKRPMFWSDMVRPYPELLEELPEDLIVLDWGYDADHDFAGISTFTDHGLTTYACPGTSAWVSLFPRLHESMANIAGYAKAGKQRGAEGLLTTDWGDGGHYNFTELSWFGFLFGAEQAWNSCADVGSFAERFCRLFLGVDKPGALVDALVDLGDVAHLHLEGYYQSIWAHLLFAPAADKLFKGYAADASVSELGKIVSRHVKLDAPLAKDMLDTLEPACAVLKQSAKRAADPLGVLPYWAFAVDAMVLAARKLATLGEGGRNTAPSRKKLRKDMEALLKRFEGLWMARNRKSEFEIARRKFRRGMRGLG